MSTTVIAGQTLHVDAEGFLTELDEWSEDLAVALGTSIGLDLTDRHLEILRWLRQDYSANGETATLRRVSTQLGVPVKELFALFPVKPAKKMAYVAGLPKPRGCV